MSQEAATRSRQAVVDAHTHKYNNTFTRGHDLPLRPPSNQGLGYTTTQRQTTEPFPQLCEQARLFYGRCQYDNQIYSNCRFQSNCVVCYFSGAEKARYLEALRKVHPVYHLQLLEIFLYNLNVHHKNARFTDDQTPPDCFVRPYEVDRARALSEVPLRREEFLAEEAYMRDPEAGVPEHWIQDYTLSPRTHWVETNGYHPASAPRRINRK